MFLYKNKKNIKYVLNNYALLWALHILSIHVYLHKVKYMLITA